MNRDYRDLPLVAKYDVTSIWKDVQQAIGLRQKLGETAAIIAIALYEGHKAKRAISYSRSKSHYNKESHRFLTYRKVLETIDYMAENNFIKNNKKQAGERGWQSSMTGTSKLIDLIEYLLSDKTIKPAMPHQAIVLRDKKGKALDIKSTRANSRMACQLNRINKALIDAEVYSHDGRNLASPVIRIFNLTQSRGGRCYGLGSNWQNERKEDRAGITINGEKIVELDFSSLHPSMLYAETSAPLPDDCYNISSWPRDLVKRAMLITINAPNIKDARGAIANCLEMKTYQPNIGSATTRERERLASSLIADIKQVHAPIAYSFHSDAGARLMRQDSDIAVAVMLDLQRQGIVALPIHDSFLVQRSKQNELEMAMMTAARHHGLPNIRIKVSA